MELNFYLSDKDAARLFAIMELQGKHNVTGNEFARQLLEQALWNLFPDTPEYDEEERLVNADKYTGRTNSN